MFDWRKDIQGEIFKYLNSSKVLKINAILAVSKTSELSIVDFFPGILQFLEVVLIKL